MPLQEEMVTQGRFLFKKRGVLPWLFVPVIILAFLEAKDLEPEGWHWFDHWLQLLSFGVCICGLLVRGLTVGCVPKRTSGRGTKSQYAETLNTTGAYSLCRHPIYFGNYLFFLGFSLLPAVWWLPVVYTLIFWLYYERIMLVEEDFLRGKFDREYFAWSETTPAFVPRLSSWQPPQLPFSMRMVLRRETSPWLGAAAGFWALETLLDLFTRGSTDLDLLWPSATVVTGVAYLAVRTVKKKTKLLDAPRDRDLSEGDTDTDANSAGPSAGARQHDHAVQGV